MSQPLLWYRLFPNVTYPEGVLGALILACAPIVILLVWLVVSKRWELNGLQILAFLGACLVFLVGGVIVSTKIGGGNNLHNMDLFFVSIAILCGLALRGEDKRFFSGWPKLAQILLGLSILVSVWATYSSGATLILPPNAKTIKALGLIQTKAAEASQHGPVLFIDQRQLLTFGYLQDIELVPDYEKKFLMDQAMAGNQAYLEQFYKDLADQRFSLIVSDPLFTKIKDNDYAFAEENNAWVKHVAIPLLCYYTLAEGVPGKLLKEYNIQLLVPKENPQNCP